MSNIRKRCCCYTRGFEKNIDYKGMEEIINKYPTIIVDVRSEQEFKEGHINGAINIPLYKVKSDFPKKVKNKNEYRVLYCTSGIRSKKAQNILISMGYTNVYNLISEFY